MNEINNCGKLYNHFTEYLDKSGLITKELKMKEPNDYHEDEVDTYGPTLEDWEYLSNLEDILIGERE